MIPPRIPPRDVQLPAPAYFSPWGEDMEIAPVFGGWLIRWKISVKAKYEDPYGSTYTWEDKASITFIPDPEHTWGEQERLDNLIMKE